MRLTAEELRLYDVWCAANTAVANAELAMMMKHLMTGLDAVNYAREWLKLNQESDKAFNAWWNLHMDRKFGDETVAEINIIGQSARLITQPAPAVNQQPAPAPDPDGDSDSDSVDSEYCHQCNLDDHRCGGCGAPINHGEYSCPICKADDGQDHSEIPDPGISGFVL